MIDLNSLPKRYSVYYSEQVHYAVEVEANSPEEALEKWRNDSTLEKEVTDYTFINDAYAEAL